jgi:hypothetical protein
LKYVAPPTTGNKEQLKRTMMLWLLFKQLLCTFVGEKTVEQQQLQSIKRLRELAIKQQEASQKKLVSLYI